MRPALLDAGPLVALLDAADPEHDRVVTVFASWRGRLLTTGAVVNEAFHLLRYASSGAEKLVEFLEQTRTTVVDVFGFDDLRRIALMMKKYADCPMDFADATLVLLAEDREHETVLTLDERGFRAYRFRGSRRFRLRIQEG